MNLLRLIIGTLNFLSSLLNNSSRSLFDPIVRPEMRESWESEWQSWIVTTDTVEDQRQPGKLKSMFVFLLIDIYKIFSGIFNEQGAVYSIEPKMLLRLQ